MKNLRYAVIVAALAAMVAMAGCKSAEETNIEPETVPAPETVAETASAEETEPEETEPEETEPEETEPETVEIPEGMAISYLTGELVPEEVANRRPISVMLSNIQQAVPQTGISKAAVIYEAPVEGMITRLMGVYEDYDDLDKIGSVRSARTYFVFWSQQWDSIYAHYGQCDYANIYLDQIDNLNGVKGSGNGVYYRTTDRKAPHNAYASAEGLEYGIDRMGYRTEHEDDFEGVFQFASQKGDVTLSDGMDATYIYPGYNTNKAYFEYDEETGTYLRYQFGGPQIDDMTGEQLAYDNIIIQYCNWEYYYETTPYLFIHIWDEEGSGYYITQGKAIPITWVGGVEYAPTSYYDADGNELVLNPGKTWICTVLTDNIKDTVIE